MYTRVFSNNYKSNWLNSTDFKAAINYLVFILGLALYKLMDYLTRMNRRKNMARHGLKQIGEHMHVVTRTMSAEPSGRYSKNIPITHCFG